MAQGSALFVDTSIQIARFVHSPLVREHIRRQLAMHDMIVTSAVVRQEFRRRLLSAAKYVLGCLAEYGSYKETMYRLARLSQTPHGRLASTGLQVMAKVDPEDQDGDLTDRVKFFCRSLILQGLQEFDESVGHVVMDSGCACSQQPIREVKKYEKYDLGTNKCRLMGSACKIVGFLLERKGTLEVLLGAIRSLPAASKTRELAKAEEFAQEVLENPQGAQALDPCLAVGDLVIALESASIPQFYTMNIKESRHFCPALRQRLIYRHPNPEYEDEVIQ